MSPFTGGIGLAVFGIPAIMAIHQAAERDRQEREKLDKERREAWEKAEPRMQLSDVCPCCGASRNPFLAR